MSTRVIIKNLPQGLSLDKFKSHFSGYEITDAKIMKTKDGRSRNFGFLGFKTSQDAKSVINYFNNTFFETRRISVEEAKQIGDQSIPRSWSKHTTKEHFKIIKPDVKEVEKEEKPKDEGLDEFLKAMKPKSQLKTWANEDLSLNNETSVIPSVKVVETENDLLYQDLPVKDKPAFEEEEEEKTSLDKIESDENQKKTKEDELFDLVSDTGRLFVRNLSYSCTEDDLRSLFSSFGEISEIHIPLNIEKNPKGFAYIMFLFPEDALKAFTELDGSTFQGRLLHILPSNEKPASPEESAENNSFKNKKNSLLKSKAKDESIWNTLFMSSDAVVESMANKLNVKKSDILNPESESMAVSVALAETNVIQETIKYLEEEGVCIDKFKNIRPERSETIILVKNIPYSSSEGNDLKEMFKKFGDIIRFVIPPTKTLALVEYSTANEAKNAFSSIAYRNYKGKPIMLEMAPTGIFRSTVKSEKKIVEPSLLEKVFEDNSMEESSTIFVKNLSFETTDSGFESCFKSLPGFRSAKISYKKDVSGKNPSLNKKGLSMGFGFLEFNSAENALRVIKEHQGITLDGHALQLKFSDRTGSRMQKNEKRNGGSGVFLGNGTKLIIRNVPFEASRKDILDLVSVFGQIKKCRLPKKFDGKSHRGFAFVEFLTNQEARNAFESLHATHLYGRHLVMEWANDEENLTSIREKTRKLYDIEQNIDMNKRMRIDIENDD